MAGIPGSFYRSCNSYFLLVLYKILTGIEDQIITIILAYAIGNGVGTVMVIKKREIKKLIFGK